MLLEKASFTNLNVYVNIGSFFTVPRLKICPSFLNLYLYYYNIYVYFHSLWLMYRYLHGGLYLERTTLNFIDHVVLNNGLRFGGLMCIHPKSNYRSILYNGRTKRKQRRSLFLVLQKEKYVSIKHINTVHSQLFLPLYLKWIQ